MNSYAMTDKAILIELGSRFKALRLRQNITQEALAESTLLSVGTIKSLEVGKAKLSTVLAALRELDALHELNNFIPEVSISPLEIAASRKTERVRAGRKQADAESEMAAESDW